METPVKETQSNRWVGIIGGGLIVLGLVGFLSMQPVFSLFGGALWAAALGVLGLALLNLYRADRSKVWALIAGYSFAAIAGLIMVSSVASLFGATGELIPGYVFSAIALPFLVIYARNRARWWALIPGGLFGMGAIIALFHAVPAAPPILLMLAGLYLLIRQRTPKQTAPAITGPAADK